MKNRDLEKEFEEKYNLYAAMLYRISFLYLGNSADAEDVLQDVFTKYFYNKNKFSSPEHEKAWLIRTTQNACLDLLKKAGRKNLNLQDVTLSVQSDNDARQDILRSVFALPPKYKIAVLLYYYNGYSVEEIARILRISKAAVKKRLQRGREMLKPELEDYAQ
ncbi:MAG: RNA polymerase sigma factor [Clostridia bacterium]|nr:RNA polymerase sigma factor [Clostridia bacterium]MBR6635522.1 RNA polymerase sigma factor [Clostridia bacterium]